MKDAEHVVLLDRAGDQVALLEREGTARARPEPPRASQSSRRAWPPRRRAAARGLVRAGARRGRPQHLVRRGHLDLLAERAVQLPQRALLPVPGRRVWCTSGTRTAGSGGATRGCPGGRRLASPASVSTARARAARCRGARARAPRARRPGRRVPCSRRRKASGSRSTSRGPTGNPELWLRVDGEWLRHAFNAACNTADDELRLSGDGWVIGSRKARAGGCEPGGQELLPGIVARVVVDGDQLSVLGPGRCRDPTVRTRRSLTAQAVGTSWSMSAALPVSRCSPAVPSPARWRSSACWNSPSSAAYPTAGETGTGTSASSA